MTALRPPRFSRELSERWKDRDAAQAYRFRPPYAPELFEILAELITDQPRVVLDIGCGTGAIARHFAPRVLRIDAIDLSDEMIAEGKRLPGGDAPNIAWRVAAAESARLDPPYALVVGGQSLHWMDWEMVFPRFAASLTRNGVVAAVTIDESDPAWREGVRAIIARHSAMWDHAPFELFPTLARAGLCEPLGERTTQFTELAQSTEDFIAALHATSTLTRAHIDAQAFDAELRALLAAHCPDGIVRRQIATRVGWGRPLARA